VGNMPLAIALSPDEKHAAVLMSGFRERGLQIVDLAAGTVTQTLPQRGAFLGVAFSPDGKSVYTSGGGHDVVYRYSWDGSRAALADSIIIAPIDTIHPRFVGAIAFSPDGATLAVAAGTTVTLWVQRGGGYGGVREPRRPKPDPRLAHEALQEPSDQAVG